MNCHFLKKKILCLFNQIPLNIIEKYPLNLALSFFTRNSQDSQKHVEWGAPAESLQDSRSHRVGSLSCVYCPCQSRSCSIAKLIASCGNPAVQPLGGLSEQLLGIRSGTCPASAVVTCSCRTTQSSGMAGFGVKRRITLCHQ